MKIRKLLIYSSLVLLIASCKKDTTPTHPIDPPEPPKPYTIVEDFETGSKGGYAILDVQLKTGTWSFNDALIGNLAADAKADTKSVRLRTGDLTMKFDIKNLEQISIKHAKYGNDAASTWQLMMSVDSGATFTQLGADINETSTTLVTDSFKINTTKKVRFRIQKTGTTRINIDDITFKGKGESGIVITTPGDGGDDGSGTGTAATPRGITVGADAPPTSGDNSDLLFGNPSGAQPAVAMMDNYLIDMGYYTESYNSTKAEPNWVSWHLDASNVTNVSSRLNNFAAFNGLPGSWTAVQSNSYNYSTYGFDRGHNCPSADRTSSSNANSATFLMTNMIPQAPNNNQGTWNDLEGYLREQVTAGNEVYIIMGSYGTGGTGLNGPFNTIVSGNVHINIPSNVWKIAVIVPVGNGDINRVSADTRVIAVNTPNVNSINRDWKQYRVTVRDIETATGYNLLSNLPQSVQDVVETKKDNL
ncbi:MAG: DNA/RNA non-specific endonuclease [Mucilaginibacter sp.]|jgi:endonuclease G|uniref:DNA/RNA non-specific endonuclease n=1 Tax=Mucilaginibacter sp. TaxID=1882438 RepID=UPI003562498D